MNKNMKNQIKEKYKSSILSAEIPLAESSEVGGVNKLQEREYYGCLRGCLKTNGDIVNFSSADDWKVLKDDYEFPAPDSLK